MAFPRAIGVIGILGIVLAATWAPVALGQSCTTAECQVPSPSDTPTGVLVDRDGKAASDPTHGPLKYYLCKNWENVCDYEVCGASPPVPLLPNSINKQDTFGFHSSALNPIQLPNPFIFYLESAYGKWWYISGTFPGSDNFKIFRTQDFVTYTVHMNAFERSTSQSLASRQYIIPADASGIDRNVLHIGSNVTIGGQQIFREFHDLWSGTLFTNPYVADPNNAGDIYLNCSAFAQPPTKLITGITHGISTTCMCTNHGYVVGQRVRIFDGDATINGEWPITAINPGVAFTIGVNTTNGTSTTAKVFAAERKVRSVYQFKIKKCDFLKWHCAPNQDDPNGVHFADARTSYNIYDADPRFGYRENDGSGTRLFDGGTTANPVPCTMPNDVLPDVSTNAPGEAYLPDPNRGQGGVWRRQSGSNWVPSFPDLAALNYDPFTFFDPLRKPSEQWATSLVYNWGFIVDDYETSDPLFVAPSQCGYHVAAGSLRTDTGFSDFHSMAAPIPLAFARNSRAYP